MKDEYAAQPGMTAIFMIKLLAMFAYGKASCYPLWNLEVEVVVKRMETGYEWYLQ